VVPPVVEAVAASAEAPKAVAAPVEAAVAVAVAVDPVAGLPSGKRRKSPATANAAQRAEARAAKAAQKAAEKEAKQAAKAEERAAKQAAKAAMPPPVRAGRKRKAAEHAAYEECDSDDGEFDPAPARKIAAVVPTHTQTLDECLSGHWAHLQAATAPPALADMLDNPTQLHGKLLAFHWEDWGWHAGRIGGTCANDANVSVLYEGRWREDHSLFASDYGTGDIGSWTLLEPVRAASPILDFANGRYKVKRGEHDKWLRADELVHHSGDDLAAARTKTAAAAAAASQAAVDEELDTGEYAIGRRVFAKALGPDGEHAWFVAQVVGHREERYPP
jgi:hypothetical protein